MLRAIIARQEGRRLGSDGRTTKTEQSQQSMPRVRDLLKDVKRQAKGCIDGMIRLLQGPYHNRPTGLALKALSK